MYLRESLGTVEWNIRKTTSRHHDAGNINAVVNAVVTKQNQNFRYQIVGDLFKCSADYKSLPRILLR